MLIVPTAGSACGGGRRGPVPRWDVSVNNSCEAWAAITPIQCDRDRCDRSVLTHFHATSPWLEVTRVLPPAPSPLQDSTTTRGWTSPSPSLLPGTALPPPITLKCCACSRPRTQAPGRSACAGHAAGTSSQVCVSQCCWRRCGTEGWCPVPAVHPWCCAAGEHHGALQQALLCFSC